MYTNLRKAAEQTREERTQKNINAIKKMTVSELKTNWFAKQYITPKTMEMIKELPEDGKPSEIVLNKIIQKIEREEQKRYKKAIEKIETVENAKDVNDFSVLVEWKRNNTWGYNPTATVRAGNTYTIGKASGCGYDKLSASIAYAMNENPEILRILYDHAEKGLDFPYSIEFSYGLPWFDGGCGVSCFRNVFDACGFCWEEFFSSNTIDQYMGTKK